MSDKFAEFLATWEKEQKTRRELGKKCLEKNKAVLLPILKSAGISVVEVEYDGAGDSGQINDVSAYRVQGEIPNQKSLRYALPKEAVTIELPSRDGGVREFTDTVEEVIRELCWELLEMNHPGWENNDGGCGTFTFHVGDELKIELSHVDYIVHEEHTVYEW